MALLRSRALATKTHLPTSEVGSLFSAKPGAGVHWQPRVKNCHGASRVVCQSKETRTTSVSTEQDDTEKTSNNIKNLADKLGVGLGPIAESFQEDDVSKRRSNSKEGTSEEETETLADKMGLSMGPIGLTVGDSAKYRSFDSFDENVETGRPAGISTEEWKARFEDQDGRVDLWVQEDFNAPSRAPGGIDSDTYLNIENRAWNGDEWDEEVPVHSVKITDPKTGRVYEAQAPEDRYILFEAEEQGLDLPMACRHGCCTQCAVKIKKGSLSQPQALGVSQELKEQGYALLCVAFPDSDLEVELQDPDEVYEMQFGKAFESAALDKNAESVERDDFALEIADMDE